MQEGKQNIVVSNVKFLVLIQPLRGCRGLTGTITTGSGLGPTPAAIIVMTPSGSGKVQLRERLSFFNRPYGTKMPKRTSYPAINRWAIIICPYGTCMLPNPGLTYCALAGLNGYLFPMALE